jgi:hypothetical protein
VIGIGTVITGATMTVKVRMIMTTMKDLERGLLDVIGAVHQGDEIDLVEGGMMRIVVGEMIVITENTREIETGTGKGTGIGAELGTGIEVRRKIIETDHALGMKIGILGIHLPLLRGGTEIEIEIAGIKMGIGTEVMDVVLTGERMITIVDCGNLDPFLLFLDRNEHKYLFLNRKPLDIYFPLRITRCHFVIGHISLV